MLIRLFTTLMVLLMPAAALAHVLRFHNLLRACLQRSFALCFHAHALHRVHHVLLIGKKGVP